MNVQSLRELIYDYLELVVEMKRLFHRRFGDVEPLRAWRSGAIPQEGWLDRDQGVKYFFHGSGCRAESGTFSVDFDFLPPGEGEGFDAWRLHEFARHGAKRNLEMRDEKVLQAAFEELILMGEIEKFERLPSPHLYQLVAAKNPGIEPAT